MVFKFVQLVERSGVRFTRSHEFFDLNFRRVISVHLVQVLQEHSDDVDNPQTKREDPRSFQRLESYKRSIRSRTFVSVRRSVSEFQVLRSLIRNILF